MQTPAPRPCGSCPYRRDCPSGVWAADEYEKLPPYDGPTGEQPPAVFLCHQQDGRLCAGWTAVHDMDENLGLRLAVALGLLSPKDAHAVCGYATDVLLFGSGTDAAEHGLALIEAPPPAAVRTITKLSRRRMR